MSGSARGKLKEEFEGIHHNLDWVRIHSEKAKTLLGDTHPEIHTMLDALIAEMKVLDESAARIYVTIMVLLTVLLFV